MRNKLKSLKVAKSKADDALRDGSLDGGRVSDGGMNVCVCDIVYDDACDVMYDVVCDVVYDVVCDVVYDVVCDVVCDAVYDVVDDGVSGADGCGMWND